MPGKNIPNLHRRLFWDTVYEEIDWQAGYKWIIARIIERGNKEEWEELIRFYGKEKVINALKNDVIFLADYAIEDVCSYFPIRKEEMLCYIRKQSKPGRWEL